jgi:hypothetical protein
LGCSPFIELHNSPANTRNELLEVVGELSRKYLEYLNRDFIFIQNLFKFCPDAIEEFFQLCFTGTLGNRRFFLLDRLILTD